jgi:hypothetical protein
MTWKKVIIVLAHAFVGWILCAATMGIGMAMTSLDVALIVHLVAAPIFFVGISTVYFRRFNYTSPMQTALIFIGFVMAMDFFVVAMLVQRSFDMFASLLGTWIPFALIWASTWITGLVLTRKRA